MSMFIPQLCACALPFDCSVRQLLFGVRPAHVTLALCSRSKTHEHVTPITHHKGMRTREVSCSRVVKYEKIRLIFSTWRGTACSSSIRFTDPVTVPWLWSAPWPQRACLGATTSQVRLSPLIRILLFCFDARTFALKYEVSTKKQECWWYLYELSRMFC